MIDRNYNNIVILCYPEGAGGNFLINCLSLNNSGVLRNAALAEQQLNSGFSVSEKIKYLTSQLDLTASRKQWNDLGLGCFELYGFKNVEYLNHDGSIDNKFNNVVLRLMQNQKYLFIIAHSIQYLDAYYDFWPNAKTIFLIDYYKFVQDRGGYKQSINRLQELNDYWNVVKGPDWPSNPPLNQHEFLQLDRSVQDELTDQFNKEIFKWFVKTPCEIHDSIVDQRLTQLKNRAFSWSVKDNFTGNEEVFLFNLTQCAQWLGITIDAHKSDIIEYYRRWRNTIDQLKQSINPTHQSN